jgi:Glycosyltransferases involved in cell wall biogenesis
MITISLCMIVKNEELVLNNALSSIKDIVDEIIIVDTGSTDKTKEIAEKFTDKIFDFEWCDDFSKARNYSFSKATCDYCMWLDADDILLPEDQEKLKQLKNDLDPSVSAVMMRYHTSFDKQGNPTFTYYRERLLRRKDNFKWAGFIHEAISVSGKIEYSEVAIKHNKIGSSDPKRNLKIFEKKIAEGVDLNPREIFYYSRELYYNKRYHDAITEFRRFLNTKQGWKENCISAYQFIAYCYDEIGNKEEAIKQLLFSFLIDNPRAEICCDLGKYFLELNAYNQSIYWYKLATTCPRDDTNGAFVLLDCYNYIPYIQLCVCYYALGDYQTANEYNELAGKCKPEDTSYLYNKKLLSKLT